MRYSSFALALGILAAGCDTAAPTSNDLIKSGDGPTVTDHQIVYWALGNSVSAYVTAASPAGPVTIGCHGSVLGTPFDTTSTDTLSFSVPLGARSRSLGVTATFACVAKAAGDSTPFALVLDDPGVADSPPVFDSLLMRSYEQADSVDPKTIGVRYIVHDDFGLRHWKVERSDSAACPCTPLAEDDLNSQAWIGVMFLYIYHEPGTYYFKTTLTDDAGQTSSVWRGPIQVPLPDSGG